MKNTYEKHNDMQGKYYLILICLLASINSMAQREKKIEHLLTIDTANVTLRDARAQKHLYTEKNQESGDTIVRKRFYADGIAERDDYYYRYYYGNPQKYSRISFDDKTKKYILYPAYEGLVPTKAHFVFNSKLSTGWVNRLPKRQNEYGQSVSPDDIFSWGEPVNASYDPYDIFRSPFGAFNSLDYSVPLCKKTALFVLRYANTTNKGIVPEASSGTNNFRLNFVNLPFPWFFNEAGIKANYLETRNNLTENGSNYARLFYNIAATPPDFDNSRGGYNGGKAYTNTDGSEHRYANSVDNPYRYIDNSLDEEKLRKASASFSLEKKSKGNDSWYWGGGYDYSRKNIRSGIMPYEPTMIENANGREETFKALNSALQYNYSSVHWFDKWNKRLNYTLSATYNLNAINYNADYTHTDSLSLNRITNDLGVSLNGNFDENFLYKFWLNANHSNTLNKEKVYFNNGLNVAVRVEQLFRRYDWWDYPLSDFISNMKLRYSLSQTQSEAPLYYSQPHYGSTRVDAGDFRNYQEQYPLYQASSLNTEKTLRNEVGIDLGLFYNRYNLVVNYFWDKTTDGTLPVYQNNRFELINAVDWNKEGWEITFNYGGSRYWRRNGIDWEVEVNFTSYKTMVKRLLVNDDRIPLAGFSDVSVSVLEGQPYGMIYGQKKDGTTGVIGNPTPDFALNVNPTLRWKEWQLSCSAGYVHGGDCWNGTRNTMNYLGVSEQSAQNRTAQTPSGSPYYPDGITGIAEEAVENASTVRFHTIALSYDFSNKVEIPELILSLGINNLIVWSAYSGVDAARPLFGYTAAQGLDYFNMPGATNVTFAVAMKF
jgi:hypothetical protein